jgi:hypothetical protein
MADTKHRKDFRYGPIFHGKLRERTSAVKSHITPSGCFSYLDSSALPRWYQPGVDTHPKSWSTRAVIPRQIRFNGDNLIIFPVDAPSILIKKVRRLAQILRCNE